MTTLAKRTATLIILVPAFAYFIAIGGWAYSIFITLILCVAGWEYWRLFRIGGHRPSLVVLIPGIATLAICRHFLGFTHSDLILSVVVMAALAVSVFGYEGGREHAATDFAITAAGVLYLGWLGGYFISLRSVENGQWWVLVALPAVWVADLGAFFAGRWFGRHRFAPRVSPKKTWEGYFGGIVTGALLTAFFAWLWHLRAPGVQPLHGLVMGAVLGATTPLGDLAESMLKRQFGVKDSSNLLPGHGGVLDRIDSWLWAMTIGYYIIIFLMR